MNNRSQIKLWMKVLCVALIILAPSACFALASVRFAIEEMCKHIEGNLGGLLMVTAGVGGMISAAFGNMKALYSCIVTGIGAFSASTMLSLYFPEAYAICSGNGGGAGGGAAQRTKSAVVSEVSKINEVAAVQGFLKLGTSDAARASDTSGNFDTSVESPVSAEEDTDADLF